MKRLAIFLRTHSKAFGALLITLLACVGLKKGYDMAAPPHGEKDCDYTFTKRSAESPVTIKYVEIPNSISLKQKGGTINDASCLNKTNVYGIVNIKSIDEVRDSLKFARENDLKITSAGQQHSMGGQSFNRGGLVLDMKGLNALTLNKETRILTAQSGATWEQIQKLLDAEGLSVKAMQSINIFTVGGTLSVNAHGIAHEPGQVAPTVTSMRVMTSNGEIKTASPTENAELFKAVLGGYGLFGVILDVDLEVVDNETYEWKAVPMNYKDFPEYYKNNIEGNKNIGLMYGRISLSPTSYLQETFVHQYEKIQDSEPIPALTPTDNNWVNRLIINFSKTGGLGRWFRWNIEKFAGSYLHDCISRNQAMSDKEVCIVSRNEEMYDAMGYLKNRLPDTDILQEYFIPHDKMVEFIDGLRTVVKTNDANLLNVTIRIVTKDTITLLPYAPEDRFAFVLYFNQKFNDRESEILKKTTSDLIDLSTSLGGRYYLPYQLYYSKEQLQKTYPEIDTFFATKKKLDPTELFTNTMYEKYGK